MLDSNPLSVLIRDLRDERSAPVPFPPGETRFSMGRQPGHADQKILIYLTLDGKPCAGTQPANYCRLSYRENIVQWLTRSQERVRAGAVAVRDVCEQYLKTIAMLCGGTDMNTSEDTSQVDAFLR